MEGTLHETGTVPREAGTVVSHLQTGVKDLQKTSLPLPLDVTGSRKVWRSLNNRLPYKTNSMDGQRCLHTDRQMALPYSSWLAFIRIWIKLTPGSGIVTLRQRLAKSPSVRTTHSTPSTWAVRQENLRCLLPIPLVDQGSSTVTRPRLLRLCKKQLC